MFDEMKIIETPGTCYHHTIGIKNPQVGMASETHKYAKNNYKSKILRMPVVLSHVTLGSFWS